MAIRYRINLRGEDLGIFDPDEVEIEHAMMLEDKTGMSIVDLVNGISRLSARPLQALVWFQKVRGGEPATDLHGIKFKIGELKSEDLSDEGPADPTSAAEATQAATGKKASATSDAATSAS